jgi:hypothetical protein
VFVICRANRDSLVFPAERIEATRESLTTRSHIPDIQAILEFPTCIEQGCSQPRRRAHIPDSDASLAHFDATPRAVHHPTA